MDASKWESSTGRIPTSPPRKPIKTAGQGYRQGFQDYNNCTSAKFNVIVENGELEGVTLYNAANGNTDTEKTAFAYSAVKSSFALAKTASSSRMHTSRASTLSATSTAPRT